MRHAFAIVVLANLLGCGGSAIVEPSSSRTGVESAVEAERERDAHSPDNDGEPSSQGEPPRLLPSHFERIFRELRDGISNEGLFAPTMTIHRVSGSSPNDIKEEHEEALGWDRVLAMIERLQHGYRAECLREEPPPTCEWHVGIDYLGEPRCTTNCCETSEPQQPGVPHLRRVCFDEQLRANALTIQTAR